MAASRGPLSGLVENFKPGGLHAAIGILAALHHRARTGAGQHLDVNLLSSALSGTVNQSAWLAGPAAG